jgi:hypothetical protein
MPQPTRARVSHTQMMLNVFNPNSDKKISASEIIDGIGALMDFSLFAAKNPPHAQSFHITPEALSQQLQYAQPGTCTLKPIPPTPEALIARAETIFTRANVDKMVAIEYPKATDLQPHITRWHKEVMKGCSI